MSAFMEGFLIAAGVALFVMMVPILYRVVVGPGAIDRIVAINVIGTKTAVLLLVIGALFNNIGMFVDFVPREFHDLHQKDFKDSVTANFLESFFLTKGRQLNSLIRDMFYVTRTLKTLKHAGNCRGRNIQSFR